MHMKKLLIKSAMIAAANFGAIFGASAVLAASPLKLSSEIFVERSKTADDGQKSIVLEEPNTVLPGDNLVFIVSYKNIGDQTATDFTVTNPMPRAVRFAGSSNGAELVSVDGGESWGSLPQLRISDSEGNQRPASMADVTHIKWNLKQTLAPGQGGKIVFRGVVK